MNVPSALLIVLCVVATPAAAFAQAARPERPYRGLFASGQGDTEQSLSATASTGIGYDNNVYADQNARTALPVNLGGASSSEFTSVSGSLAYSLSRKSVSLFAAGSSSAQYYFRLNSGLVTNYAGNVGVSWTMSPRTHLSANSSLSYQPLTAYAFFPEPIELAPGATPLPNSLQLEGHFGTARESYVTVNSGVQFGWDLSKRSTISFNYGRMMNNYSASNFDVTSNSVGGRFTHTLSKGVGLHAGYIYSDTDYGGGLTGTTPFAGRTLDVGIDYSRALSFSRRTTLSFSTATAAFSDPVDTRFLVSGTAHLNREIGRSWNASLSYLRGVDFANELRAPTVSDSITGGFSGLMSRRVQFHAVAGAARGEIGLTNGNPYTSFTASTGVAFDLNRSSSLSIEYGYYNYDLGTAAVVIAPVGVPSRLNRQTVQAYVTFWLPIFHRAGRPNATR